MHGLDTLCLLYTAYVNDTGTPSAHTHIHCYILEQRAWLLSKANRVKMYTVYADGNLYLFIDILCVYVYVLATDSMPDSRANVQGFEQAHTASPRQQLLSKTGMR